MNIFYRQVTGGNIRKMNEQQYKPAWRSFYQHFFTMVACLAVASMISVNLSAKYQKWLWLVFLGAITCIVCNMVYKRNSVLLIVKSDKVALDRGIIGRQSIEISTRSIRTIKVNQSIMQRIFNVGDVRVASSGTDEYEISALNMPNPHEIRQAMQMNERAAAKEEEHGKAESKT